MKKDCGLVMRFYKCASWQVMADVLGTQVAGGCSDSYKIPVDPLLQVMAEVMGVVASSQNFPTDFKKSLGNPPPPRRSWPRSWAPRRRQSAPTLLHIPKLFQLTLHSKKSPGNPPQVMAEVMGANAAEGCSDSYRIPVDP